MRIAAEPSHAQGWAYVRQRRDALLAKSDRYMMPDYPHAPGKQALWTKYRRALRDVTKVPHPDQVIWPQEPS